MAERSLAYMQTIIFLLQGHSTTLGFSTGLFQRFQNPKDKRDFVTAGGLLRQMLYTISVLHYLDIIWSIVLDIAIRICRQRIALS